MSGRHREQAVSACHPYSPARCKCTTPFCTCARACLSAASTSYRNAPKQAPSTKGRDRTRTQVWEAFRAVAVEPAFDPIQKWGEDHAVRSAGFLFEALYSEGWPSRHGHRGMPEHYELSFQRRFAVGDYGDMLGLDLSVFVAAADELRALGATLNGDDRGDLELFAPVAHDWIAQVEASPAFVTPMRRHPALRFSFGVDGIG